MKPKAAVTLCAIVMVALVLFGLLYGASAGWREQRAQVDALFAGENGLDTVLAYRGADGLNLAVVAARHLPEGDEALTALRAASDTLRGGETLRARAEAAKAQDAAIARVQEALQGTTTYPASARDQDYVDMLTREIAQLARSKAIAAYNESARDFNARLAEPFSGFLASVVGVHAVDTFDIAQ